VYDEDHDTFRNELASIQRDGRRRWVFARQPSGPRYRARTVLSWFLLAFLFGAPFITVNGQQLLLLDFLERRFVFFGLVFWPQDFYLVVLLALTVLVGIALLTVAAGRLWCGWVCPQTIFMEMLFRKIEYLIDGTAAQQVRLAKAPWTFQKAWRRVLKIAIFFGLSFVIANVFLAYIIGSDELITIVTDPIDAHIGGLVAISIFSAVFFAVFYRFREQACTFACPYGRMMSALTDRHTQQITYDWTRGEPRGHVARGAGDTPLGDCIDCAQCVTVCPTGIDIRNGSQLECVACTACMDACDTVMRKVSRPVGLIRTTSVHAIETSQHQRFPTRVRAYAAIWLVLLAALVTLLWIRPPVDILVLRQAGTLYVTLPDNQFGNFYTVQIVNRTGRAHTLDYRVVSPARATLTALGSIDTATPHGLVVGRFLLSVPGDDLTGTSTPIVIDVLADGRPLYTINSAFLGPGATQGAHQ
jgi:cytochrome c oxidase accessory protein FixG